VTLVVGSIIHALFEIAGQLIGGPARIRRFTRHGRVLFFAGIPILGTAIGAPLGLWLAGARRMSWFEGDDGQRAIVVSLAFWALAAYVIYHWFAAKAQAIVAEREAAEAQLRLLQAQIEPHFLFNTLANVSALIDHDAPEAKRTLGAFTDYLRASVTHLRREQGSLDDELALAEAYLRVQQSRMEERLAFTIEAADDARRAALPPLLLQPLVENAVQHGLEPQLRGGRLQVQARCEGRRLVIDVRDDGRGLAAPARKGQGVALANVRARLASRYGDAASLALSDAAPGTLARLTLPLQTAPCSRAPCSPTTSRTSRASWRPSSARPGPNSRSCTWPRTASKRPSASRRSNPIWPSSTSRCPASPAWRWPRASKAARAWCS
jgi:hypothetical protein